MCLCVDGVHVDGHVVVVVVFVGFACLTRRQWVSDSARCNVEDDCCSLMCMCFAFVVGSK